MPNRPETFIARLDDNARFKNLEVTAGLALADDGLTGVVLPPQILTVTGAIEPARNHVQLSHATVVIAATRVAPVAGHVLIVTNTSPSGTAAHTVTLPAGVTWNGTNRVATLDAPGKTLVCIATSATRYLVLVNIGSVAFSG